MVEGGVEGGGGDGGGMRRHGADYERAVVAAQRGGGIHLIHFDEPSRLAQSGSFVTRVVQDHGVRVQDKPVEAHVALLAGVGAGASYETHPPFVGDLVVVLEHPPVRHHGKLGLQKLLQPQLPHAQVEGLRRDLKDCIRRQQLEHLR